MDLYIQPHTHSAQFEKVAYKMQGMLTRALEARRAELGKRGGVGGGLGVASSSLGVSAPAAPTRTAAASPLNFFDARSAGNGGVGAGAGAGKASWMGVGVVRGRGWV